MGRVLHDGHHRDDRRLQGSPRSLRAGQAFTVVLLLGGVGAALYTFTLLATVVVEGGLPKRLQRRRHARMLETIKDHFIVCGYGRIGSIVARQFQRQQVPLVVVERDPERIAGSDGRRGAGGGSRCQPGRRA